MMEKDMYNQRDYDFVVKICNKTDERRKLYPDKEREVRFLVSEAKELWKDARNRHFNLEHADLHGLLFAHAHLSHSNLRNANLRGTRWFAGSYCEGSDFTGADFSGAKFLPPHPLTSHYFDHAKLLNTDFSGAELCMYLRGATLERATFRNTVIRGIEVDDKTSFADVDFTGASCEPILLINGKDESMDRFLALLTKEQKIQMKSGYGLSRCFVATVTCRNPYAEEVIRLTAFRDQLLVKHALGRLIVDSYEILSPPLAQILRSHPRISRWVRTLVIRPLSVLTDTFLRRFGK